MKNLKCLDLSFNQLNQFGSSVFTSIPSTNLEQIDLSNNRIISLPEGVFEGESLKSLVKLSLHKNNISKIPHSVFNSNFLSNLTEVKIHHNFINKIEAFSPLSGSTLAKLKELNLEFNHLEMVSSDMFKSESWKSLERLKLDNNNISKLPGYMFSSRFVSRLNIFSVTYNLLDTLPGNLFHGSNLPYLSHLNFSHNSIKWLPVSLFSQAKTGDILIIPTCPKYVRCWKLNFPNLTYSRCLRYMPCKPVKNLTHLDLSFNKLTHIPDEFFLIGELKRLKLIKLNNNFINKISARCFPDNLEHLHILDLSYNMISVPMVDIFTLVLSSKEALPLLNMSHNQLTVQENFNIDKSSYKFQMLHFDMSFNNISRFHYRIHLIEDIANKIGREPLTLITALKTVLDRIWTNVEGNQVFSITNLVETVFELNMNDSDWQRAVKNLESSSVIQLHSIIKTYPYTYNCNCDMVKYLILQRTKYFKKSLKLYQNLLKSYKSSILRKHGYISSNNDFNNLHCGAPPELAGKYLFEVVPSKLQCHDSKCTDNLKSLCSYIPANSTIRINCTRCKLKHLPSITQNASSLEVYLGFNNMVTFPVPKFHVTRNITVLDLSYNLINSIANELFTHFPKIQKLNLAGNLLIDLPSLTDWNRLNILHYLELGDNRFMCNCSGLSLKKTLISLNKRVMIPDIDKVTCFVPVNVKNRVIYDAPDSLYGCPYLNLILILTLLFTLLLLIVILLFIAYLFRDYIQLFLFIHFGWRFFYSYPREKTLYDVFVSYSSLDSDWVEEHLVNPLERLDPPYNLCLHERDFQVGIPICDNITRAIEGSKCTLVVVSRNWLESDWCQFEFRVAHCLATVEKQSRLIVVIKENIPREDIKGDLDLYIKTFTYLDSANRLFWPRLLTDLPVPNKARNQKEAHKNCQDLEL